MLAATVAPAVLRSVLDGGKRLEPALAEALSGQRTLGRVDRRFVARCLSALLRWWGWIAPLRLVRIEEQLLLAWLLESTETHAVGRIWARKVGRDPEQLYTAGDAPNWTARAEGLKRFSQGRPVTADPWLLFPAWLRDQLPVPPGDQSPKVRRLAFLQCLQTRPALWVRVRSGLEKKIWAELREAGVKPWIHRRLTTAAKVEEDVALICLRPSSEGELVIEDLSSQALGLICDPDPGERWWDVCGGPGTHAIHLASLMDGKGTVITTLEQENWRKETALRIRRSPFSNVAVKVWDGGRLPAKTRSFDGVLVDAPCSGVGTWRRHPEARWSVRADQIPILARRQLQLLDAAANGVRPGGVLVYSVATCTLAETQEVVSGFLSAHADFHLDPFPNPLEESTTPGILQIWPQQHDTEARFIARMIRVASASPAG